MSSFLGLVRLAFARVSVVPGVLEELMRELSWLVKDVVVLEDISLSPFIRFCRWKPYSEASFEDDMAVERCCIDSAERWIWVGHQG
jgi:hypothetical protein